MSVGRHFVTNVCSAMRSIAMTLFARMLSAACRPICITVRCRPFVSPEKPPTSVAKGRKNSWTNFWSGVSSATPGASIGRITIGSRPFRTGRSKVSVTIKDDPRPAHFTLEMLARGRTDEALWDAAQASLLIHGELHNNVRMTWGKALLNWTEGPEDCWQKLVDLNHRYALDGRDPNSYGG